MTIGIKDNINYKLPLRVTSFEKEEIINFAKANYLNKDLFSPNGHGRQFCMVLEKDVSIKNLVLNIRDRFMTELGITEWQEEPMFGIFIGVNTEGGAVHEHTDTAPNTHFHLRLNVMLQKPVSGGNPIMNQKEISIEEDETWINIADYWKHASTPVIGNKERIVMSIGSFVPKTNEYLKSFFTVS